LALREYLSKKQLPNLPTEFTDEVGTLMADTSHTLKKLDEVIHYMTSYDDLTDCLIGFIRDRLQALSQVQRNNHY